MGTGGFFDTEGWTGMQLDQAVTIGVIFLMAAVILYLGLDAIYRTRR